MTRREGTSKSIWVDATARFAPKANGTQMQDSPRKINIARDLVVRFGFRQVKLVQLLIVNRPVTTRSHEKFVLDKITYDQGPAWRQFF